MAQTNNNQYIRSVFSLFLLPLPLFFATPQFPESKVPVFVKNEYLNMAVSNVSTPSFPELPYTIIDDTASRNIYDTPISEIDLSIFSESELDILKNVHPELQERVVKLKYICKEYGCPIRITQGYRAFTTQDELYEQGRNVPVEVEREVEEEELYWEPVTDVSFPMQLAGGEQFEMGGSTYKMESDGSLFVQKARTVTKTVKETLITTDKSKIVTNAKGGQSYHNYGLAVDFCRNDGKAEYDESDYFFQRVGAVAEALGLEWGGKWKSIKDMPHVQLPWFSLGEVSRLYGDYAAFKATWVPSFLQEE